MIYFDNAATSYPKPNSIVEELRHCIEEYCGNPGRGSHRLALRAAEKIYELRCEAAELLGVSTPENIILVPNATFALNLAIKTRVRTGSHILMSDQEHNAVRRPVMRLAADGIASYSIYSSYGDIEKNIAVSVRPESDILICNPVSNVTGHTISLTGVMRAAKKHGLYLIVDASQWIGHFEIPCDLASINAFCAPGHKGLYGLQGSGFLYLRSAKDLASFIEGGSGSESKNPSMPSSLPERYEAGTVSTPCAVSLLEGIRFIKQIGISEIDSHESALTMQAFDALSGISGIRIWGREDHGGSLLSFSHERLSPDDICDALDRYGICTRAGFHCAPLAHQSAGTDPRGTVRVSFGIFNTKKEVDVLYNTLKRIIFEV